MGSGIQVSNLQGLLQQFRDRIKNNRDRGTAFERLIKSYLSTDPIYKARFKKVSLWSEWAHKWGPDCGIDLVAETEEGEFAAIQCKFFAPDYLIQKNDIDSFFTESGRTFSVQKKSKSFSQRIIVSSSDRWSANAESSLESQTIDVIRIHIRDLESSPIDWSKFSLDKPDEVKLRTKKKLRPHQESAIGDVLKGFKEADRGKLIMACGTGKTFTALRLAEKVAPKTGAVLFLVPSISLLSQTLREWTAESERPFHAFAVCSDQKVGRDSEDISKHDLAIPATTDTSSLLKGYESAIKDKQMVVVFSTYQSIDVISKAQKKGLPEFDLVICDEAHRTTGVTLADEDESHFVKVHDDKFLKAKKRLYMTATPRIFGNAVKEKANEAGAELCSMDDEGVFGPEFHRLGFGQAVSQNLLTDYKVLVLAVDESVVKPSFQKKLASEDKEIPLEDIAKIIGCWNGLSKRFVGTEAEVEDTNPMRRAVAFARSIKDSKQVAGFFQSVVEAYVGKNKGDTYTLKCELEHVDGTFNVLERNARLDWLKAETPASTCRILSNARCLSEGVDVPALDAVLFLNSRDSQVDVVQSVGRIMRKAEGKKYGYVILPVAIPAGIPPEEALKDNKRYKVVWQVLQALRAHDDRFDALINQMQFNKKRPAKIQVIGVGGGSDNTRTTNGDGPSPGTQVSLALPEIEEWKDSIYARIVLKCGSRLYWENWAADVARIAEKNSKYIQSVLKSRDSKARKEFDKFLTSIRKNINPSVSETDAVEMLSQHLITKPVFDALFEHYPFTEKNPVSRSMQSVLKVFENSSFAAEREKLKPFYDSIRLKVRGIDNAEGRQKVIIELYDRFFKVAFPKMAERLGIVYTPVEIVDFIIRSVQDVLETQFRQSLSDKNVHILDPFTGTGTFIVRLLQSGAIRKEDIKRKFTEELHANEIVLLAYYIAAINIEETFHGITSGDYESFDGIVLTDTFQLTEDNQEEFETLLPENTARVRKQRKSPIRVIIGNPPYSVGQKDANDNNQNEVYPKLDSRIRDTYAALSTATNKNSLYDSYIRSIRWASDRIERNGVIGFVTNGSFIDSNSADGLRKSLGKEFAKIYCFNLRGNARTQGEDRRKEKGNVFGEGSRTPVAITIMVKDESHSGECEILYHDIGDYLSREDKLRIVDEFKSIRNLPWKEIEPNEEGDWVNQRSPEFEEFSPLGNKSDRGSEIFETYSSGVKTNRDRWCYNYSRSSLSKNMSSMIRFYNSEVKRLTNAKKKNSKIDIESFTNNDATKISWNRSLRNDLAKLKEFEFDSGSVVKSLYRPFSKANLYFNRTFNDMVYQIPKLFPTPEHENLVIGVTGLGVSKPFSVILTDVIPDVQLLANGQCFPRYFYEKADDEGAVSLRLAKLKPDKHGYIRRDAISDEALAKFRTAYGLESITKEAIFYYIYGVLHSPAYRSKYKNDLSKMLPRIPYLADFDGYRKVGESLAKLHVNYEKGPVAAVVKEEVTSQSKAKSDLYRVDSTGMKFGKIEKKEDRTTIIFNSYLKLQNIPLEVYEYIVNGKSALEWVMERYAVTVDKDSGIKNDPNEWSSDPRYIVDLVKRVVWVSLETNRLVAELPEFQILDAAKASRKKKPVAI
jgi:predicted helicase